MIELKKFRNGRLKERTLPLYKGKNSGTRVGEKSDLIKCPDEMKTKIRTRYSEFFLNLIPMESIDFVYDSLYSISRGLRLKKEIILSIAINYKQNHVNKLFSYYKYKGTTTYPKLLIKYGVVTGCLKYRDICESKSGENNPWYQHNGKYSKMSKNYFNGYDQKERDKIVEKIRESNKTTRKANTRVEYYLDIGYSLNEARKMVSLRQTTFSYDKCIEKYGKDLGESIWKSRQERWLNTLAKKTPSELKEINRKKTSFASGHCYKRLKNNKIFCNTLCSVYYIMIELNGNTFYKIGITKNFEKRFNFRRLSMSNIKLTLLKIANYDYLTSFLIEQNILKTYKAFRTRVDNELIHGSEFFTSDVLHDKEVSNFFSDDIVEKRALFMKRFHNEVI